MSASNSNIGKMPAFDSDTDTLNMIIEAPRGSSVKFKYDEKHNLFQFDKVLPSGLVFPFEFGFLPSTLGGDGDPLDVVVLSQHPTFVGCLVLGRLLGAIEAEQTDQGKTQRNDRLIAMPVSAKTGEPQGTTTKLDDKLAAEILKFFISYNAMQDKKFKPLNVVGPDQALRTVKDGIARARKEKSKR